MNGYTGVTAGNPLGDLRPFSVSYYRGSIYVGAVNTAESTTLGGTVIGDRNALRAYVFQYKLNVDANGNPTGGGAFVDLNGVPTATAAVLVVPLNYNRGYIQVGVADASQTRHARLGQLASLVARLQKHHQREHPQHRLLPAADAHGPVVRHRRQHHDRPA